MSFLLLQAQQQSMIPTLVMFGGAWACSSCLRLIRPQSKARKAMQERLPSSRRGRRGPARRRLYATIDRVEDQAIYVKLGSAVVKARKTAVVALAGEPALEQN